MPIFVPDLFSGYLNGRRAAIKDNWTDQTNYNSVLGGQLKNAFDMETFDDAARIAHNRAAVSDMQRVDSALDTTLGLQAYQAGQDAGLIQKRIEAQIAQYDAIINEAQQRKAELLSQIPQDVGTSQPQQQTTTTTNNPNNPPAAQQQTTTTTNNPNNPPAAKLGSKNGVL